MRQDIHNRAARLAEHEAPDAPLLVAERVDDLEGLFDRPGVQGINVATSKDMPGAAMSSLPTMVTWAEGLVADARVTTHPRSIATSKPSRSMKKSRVSAGRSDLMFGAALSIVTGPLPHLDRVVDRVLAQLVPAAVVDGDARPTHQVGVEPALAHAPAGPAVVEGHQLSGVIPACSQLAAISG
jgi:hypothetical protein